MHSDFLRYLVAVTAFVATSLALVPHSPASLASLKMPSQGCVPATASGRQVNALRGYLIHDGYAGADSCHLLLVGESSGAEQMGVVLRSDDGGKTIGLATSVSKALHLRYLAFSGASMAWLVGDTSDGRGVLLASTNAGRSWQPVHLHPAVAELDGVAVAQRTVWVAGEVGRSVGVQSAAFLASTDDGAHWREVMRVPPASPDHSARFEALAVSGPTIIAVGTDGWQGAIMISHDGGHHVQRSSASSSFTSATHVSLADRAHVYILARKAQVL